MQRSFLSGSEPLATALIFGAFLAVRKERYVLASLLASSTAVVRPLGVFCLVGVAIVLLRRREFKKMALVIAIGIAVGTLYVIPLAAHFGDTLATLHSYQGGGRALFGFPFYAIIEGTLLYPVPFTNLALSFGWILLILSGVSAMISSQRFREYAAGNQCEILFLVPYLMSTACYNYPVFARTNFARFSIPILPLVYLALLKWMPKDRRLLWALGLVTPVLAAASALGIRNVIHLLTIKT